MKSVQVQFRWLFYTLSFIGFYPPGIEILVQNIMLLRMLFIIALQNPVYSTSAGLAGTIFIILNRVPVKFAMWIIRRSIFCTGVYGSLFIHYHMNLDRLKKLFEVWNLESFNIIEESKREMILKEVFRPAKFVLLFSGVTACGITLAYFLRVIADRYCEEANLVFYPHDVDTWYHFPMVYYQTLGVVKGTAGLMAVHAVYILLISMVITQLKILKLALRSALVNDDCMNQREVRNGKIKLELCRWIKCHIRSLRWIKDILYHLEYFYVIKFLILAVYVSLCAFSVSTYVKMGQYKEIVLLVGFMFPTFTIMAYESHLADIMAKESEQMFGDNIDSDWYLLPVETQRSIHIIAVYCSNRPIRVKSMYILVDNLRTFLSVMQLAYQSITFLLQINI